MPKLVENALIAYTDGSLFPRGRHGGYGMVFVYFNEIGEDIVVRQDSPPGVSGTTNNRMELQACIQALKTLPEIECFASVRKVGVRTDSRYVTDHYRLALGTWKKNRWCNRDGKPIENADLWKEFERTYWKLPKPKLIEWVPGHGKGKQKDIHNVRADSLARASAKSPLGRESYRSSVRRKLAPGRTRVGSVHVCGQALIIYVIENKPMRVQRTSKYRYQVVSPESPDCRSIDWLFSKEHMRDGHAYEVQLNADMKYPQVLSVLREVPRDEALRLIQSAPVAKPSTSTV